jgi:hypothetical protein
MYSCMHVHYMTVLVYNIRYTVDNTVTTVYCTETNLFLYTESRFLKLTAGTYNVYLMEWNNRSMTKWRKPTLRRNLWSVCSFKWTFLSIKLHSWDINGMLHNNILSNKTHIRYRYNRLQIYCSTVYSTQYSTLYRYYNTLYRQYRITNILSVLMKNVQNTGIHFRSKIYLCLKGYPFKRGC